LDCLVRCADAGSAALLAHVLALRRKTGDMQRQAPRRGERLRALVEEAALDQRVRDELAQVFGPPALHAGRNFLAEEFEQEIGHAQAVE
jgi:hypothetical protein